MDIKNWASIICIVAIVSGIFVVIIPESKIKKVYRVMVTSFLLYAFLLPFINKNYVSFDFSEFLNTNERLKEEYNEESYDIFEESAKKVLENEIETKLKNSGVNVKVKVECTVEEENFSVEKITVICDMTEQSIGAITEMLDEFKTENTRVVFEGGLDAERLF